MLIESRGRPRPIAPPCSCLAAPCSISALISEVVLTDTVPASLNCSEL